MLAFARRFSSISIRSGTRSFSSASPLVELREYQLNCERGAHYLSLAESHADLRTEIFPLRLFSVPETGGPLNVATHFYAYKGGWAEREECREKQSSSPRWEDYSKSTRPGVEQQNSMMFVEAPLVSEFGLHGMQEVSCPGGAPSAKTIYEIRRYNLRLGYDTVPRFLKAYSEGLPSKLNAPGTDPSTSLTTLLYSEVGVLNEVIELWRHGEGTAAMEASRQAARGAQEWRKAIAQIAELSVRFTTTIHKPLPFSPWR
eukprot:TRINITY_DN98101_c0_g1_i1.p1 TRINITY_DN98101_c0_g1~~TRINITY_DN98101_c0_g1_i1.p1  ORF type:complete len:258 (+),score=33.05 TRINITY_DN98101_c0_g1_i1:64-837(+)